MEKITFIASAMWGDRTVREMQRIAIEDVISKGWVGSVDLRMHVRTPARRGGARINVLVHCRRNHHHHRHHEDHHHHSSPPPPPPPLPSLTSTPPSP